MPTCNADYKMYHIFLIPIYILSQVITLTLNILKTILFYECVCLSVH